ncbi:MAG: peroxide stress protein YaaA [Acidobacteria bacterium]|nr:peroxide stress protein YaaA [Acidobacteriota bacterium]
MLTLLSPAKTLDFEFSADGLPTTAPRFEEDIEVLLGRCKKLTVAKLRELMKLSQPLAELNRHRFQAMTLPFTADNSKPCLLAFRGDVYRGLDAASLSKRDLKWAQNRLRILSGLYGILRPLDLMQPYRLEMGTRLSNPRGKNLYDFWGDRLVESLNAEHAERPVKAVLNLASNEYFKAVPEKQLDAPLVTALFQEIRDGKPKTISFSAKRARGLMARFIVRNRIDAPEGLKEFAEEGYGFRPELSREDRLLFVREQNWAA